MRRWAILAAVAAIGLGAGSPGKPPSEPRGKAVEAEAAKEQQQAQPATQSEQEAAKTPPARCEGAQPGEDANLCYERRTTEATEGQATQAERQFLIGIAQAVATVVSLGFTGWAAFAAAEAARAANKATSAIPILERAYVYPVIIDDSIYDALQAARPQPNRNGGVVFFIASADADPAVRFMFKNYGKTPARLIHGEVELILTPSDRVGDASDWPIRYKHVLGEGGETEPIDRTLGSDLTVNEANAIERGSATLYLSGWMTYLDVWGETQQCDVLWRYNPILKRLTPEDNSARGQSRPGAHGARLLARFLPHNWFRPSVMKV